MEVSLVVVGSAGVGKSALSIRFISGEFVSVYDPTVEENYRKQIPINDEQVLLEIFDTGGCEEYKQLRGVYISKAHGFLVVCSIVNKSSLDEADALVEEIIDVKGNVAPIMIVANKSDLDDDIKYPMQEVQNCADKWQCYCILTSAKNGHNVNEAFYQTAELAYKQVKLTRGTHPKKKRSCHLL